MARSYGALKVAVWENGSDFRMLSPLAQWAYVLLISQPQLNNLGLLPYTPEKWVRFAFGLTPATLGQAIVELQHNRYVVVDVDTGELLVRTFIKHDKVWLQPKLVTNARRLIREVESDGLRDLLTTRHPWLITDWSKEHIEGYEADAALIRETPIGTPIRPFQETPSDTGIETPPDTPNANTPIETPSDTHIPTRAPAGPGPGGTSPSTKTNSKAVNEASYEANGNHDESAANGTAQIGNIRETIKTSLATIRELPANILEDAV